VFFFFVGHFLSKLKKFLSDSLCIQIKRYR